MNEATMNGAEPLQEMAGRRRRTMGALVVTLVMTASLVASPAVKKDGMALPGSSKEGAAQARKEPAKARLQPEQRSGTGIRLEKRRGTAAGSMGARRPTARPTTCTG